MQRRDFVKGIVGSAVVWLHSKELEVLHELLPAVRTVALLVNPAD